MTLVDVVNGPFWILWVVVGFFAIISVLLLSGRGSFLISGYNTAKPEEKAKYNEFLLCRVMGFGMVFITVILLLMAALAKILPAYTQWIFLGLTLADCIVMIILSNTICKRH